MAQIRTEYPHYTEDELVALKQTEFAAWLKYYVTTCSNRGQSFPTWVEEMVNGPLYVTVSYPMYFTGGYGFKVYREGRTRSTTNYGVSSRSGDLVFYGILREILEVCFSGKLGLKCIAFLVDWYNPIMGSGMKVDKFGVTSIHSKKRLQKYEPFILASQADQVCYISYPRVRNKQDPWITATKINSRGMVKGVSDCDQLQQSIGMLGTIDQSLQVNLVVDFTVDVGATTARLHEDSENEICEFEEVSLSSHSSYSFDN